MQMAVQRIFGYYNRFDEATSVQIFEGKQSKNIRTNICSDVIINGLCEVSGEFKKCILKHIEILDFSRLGVFTPSDFHTLLCLTKKFRVIHDGDLALKGQKHKVRWRKRLFRLKFKKITAISREFQKLLIKKSLKIGSWLQIDSFSDIIEILLFMLECGTYTAQKVKASEMFMVLAMELWNVRCLIKKNQKLTKREIFQYGIRILLLYRKVKGYARKLQDKELILPKPKL